MLTARGADVYCDRTEPDLPRSDPERSFMSHFTDWTQTPGDEVVPGDVIWAVTGEGVQVIRAEMAPGSDFALHTHPHEQILVVLQGTLRFTVGDEEQDVRAGGVIHAPPGVPHGGRVVGDEPVVTIEALSPPRTDFTGGHNVDLTKPR
jgi:quercetin dioxygenase-like cupin family protein